MGLDLWRQSILPALADREMGRRAYRRLRSETTAHARGRVLEIGIGSGQNLGHYPRSIHSLIGIDPSLPLLQLAHRRAAWMAFPVRLRQAHAERLPLMNQSIDVAVSTWTLGVVDDPAAALAEIRRVLRPDGLFCFCERFPAATPAAARWWRRLAPLWEELAGGWSEDRRPEHLIESAGLQISSWASGRLALGRCSLGWHCRGVARLK